MAHLSLRVLGPPQVLIDDTPVAALESAKTWALLVYLAVEAARPHRRESLVGLLWPDCPEPVARHSLRQALLTLRQAIGDHSATPPYLLISRDALQLNRASDFTLDLAQFSAILRACEENRDTQDPSIRAARLEELVKLYRGEFLQHFFLEDSAEFEQWALVQRESLHQQVLEAHSDLASYYERHQDFQAARRHALRQLELDPWREEAHCQMMRALALDGQRTAALAQYETCRRLLAEELGVEPSAGTRELYEQIRADELRAKAEPPAPLPATRVHNLPVSLTSFVGRERELADLGRLIADPECRCISLVGPGGIGKTRLAVQAGERHCADFGHGVFFIPLAAVRSVEAAILAVASAIHFHFYGPNEPRVQLLNHLCEKQMLLIVDNVEQLLTEEPVQAQLVELVLEILHRAPGVKLLITSREVLDLQEEWVCEVRGLPFPDPEHTNSPDEYAAILLFMQRARRVSPRFAFDEADLAGIAHICRLVEGMPLALELAATWLRTLTPAEIAAEIEASLDFLSASVRDLPERHRSMRAVFDQTWRTLSANERQVLSRLSVFRGGFSRQAAEQVAGASLPILSSLVNRMLVRRAGASRYGLHELVRQYSAVILAADPETQAAAQIRHFRYFLALAETAEQELKGRSQLEWLGRLEQEEDNLRAALTWALESDCTAPGRGELALRLSGTLRWFWRMRGHFHEGLTWLTKSLRQHPEERTLGRVGALLGKSMLTYALGDLGAALLSAEESAEVCRELGDQHRLAEALTLMGLALAWQGQASLTEARLQEALAIYRKVGDRWGEARALHRLGVSQMDSAGDPARRAMLQESVAILEDLGEKVVLNNALVSLGSFDIDLGEYAVARARLERALAVAREMEHPWGIADGLTDLGRVYWTVGDYSTAQSYFERSLQVYQEHGDSVWGSYVLCALAENAIAQGDLSTARGCLQTASSLLETSENKWLQMVVCYCRGVLAHYEGDAVAALRLLEETRALAREGQYKPDLARSLLALSRVRRTLGDPSAASRLLMEGLELFRALGHKLSIAKSLEELGALSAALGDGVQAATLLSTAHALRERLGAPLPPVDRAAHDSAVATCRAQLGETAFAAAWAQAAARPFGEVVEEVLQLRPG